MARKKIIPTQEKPVKTAGYVNRARYLDEVASNYFRGADGTGGEVDPEIAKKAWEQALQPEAGANMHELGLIQFKLALAELSSSKLTSALQLLNQCLKQRSTQGNFDLSEFEQLVNAINFRPPLLKAQPVLPQIVARLHREVELNNELWSEPRVRGSLRRLVRRLALLILRAVGPTEVSPALIGLLTVEKQFGLLARYLELVGRYEDSVFEQKLDSFECKFLQYTGIRTL